MVISEEEDDTSPEVVHGNRAFRQRGYPDWAVKRGAALPVEKDSTQERQRETDSGKDMSRNMLVGLPFIEGLSEEL